MTTRQSAWARREQARCHAEHLRRCAEGEGGRAVLAVQGYANAATAAYFATEAIHYAREYVEAIAALDTEDR
jgi:hypothetical protein